MEKAIKVEFVQHCDDFDRVYKVTAGEHSFEVFAQLWDNETGEFAGFGVDAATMHYGVKDMDDSALDFTQGQRFEQFAAATGLDEGTVRSAIEAQIEAAEDAHA